MEGQLSFKGLAVGGLAHALPNSGTFVVDPHPIVNLPDRAYVPDVLEQAVRAFDTRSSNRVLLSYKVIRLSLPVVDQTVAGKLVAIEALMSPDGTTCKPRQRPVDESAQVFLAGRGARGSTERIVVGKLGMQHLRVPRVLAFVDKHEKHLGESMVDTFGPTTTIRVAKSRVGFADA